MPLTWDELPDADPREFTVATVPGILAKRACAWADIDDHAGDVAGALKLWEADLERGLGELNFPPDYPKMPGEPPRVPPSKRKADRADDEYLAPKAERDAEWGTAIAPPYGPMLAKPVKKLPEGEYLYEPKWDGFRSIIWRSGDMVEIGSRNSRPMTRYFPELVEAIIENFPDHSAIDGEIIMIDPESGDRLNFDALQQRIHPAESRIKKLSAAMPASFVAFDLLALGQTNYVNAAKTVASNNGSLASNGSEYYRRTCAAARVISMSLQAVVADLGGRVVGDAANALSQQLDQARSSSTVLSPGSWPTGTQGGAAGPDNMNTVSNPQNVDTSSATTGPTDTTGVNY